MTRGRKKSKDLTYKQSALYNDVVRFYKEHGMSPTLDELISITGKSKTTIHDSLKYIEQKGYIKIIKFKKRGIILLPQRRFFDDKCIKFREDDIEKEKNVKQRPIISNK